MIDLRNSDEDLTNQRLFFDASVAPFNRMMSKICSTNRQCSQTR